jgi:hypothetical protein
MKHVVFAEFRNQTTAREALDDLADVGIRASHSNINLHAAGAAPDDNEERPLHETDARGGIVIGLVAAAIIGALMGWLVTGPLHLFEVTTGTGIATGIALGLAIGFIGGAISGAMNPNRKLEKLERRAASEGGVIATIEVNDVSQEESVRKVFTAHGARVETRAI